MLVEYCLSLFRMSIFRAAHGWGRAKRPSPSLKSVTHILQWWNLAQLYLTQRRSKKYMNHVTHPLSSADISIFSPEISKFCYIKKCRYRLHFGPQFNFFNFCWVFKDFLNKTGYNFDDVSKKGYLGLLKINIFWNKGYDIIIPVDDITNKIL